MILLLACTTPDPVDTADSAPATDTSPDTPEAQDAAVGLEAVGAALDQDFGSLVRVGWTQLVDAEIYVAYSFEGEDWLTTPTRAVTAGEAVEELLLGVPYGTTVSYYVVTGEGAGAARTVETDPLPVEVLQPTLHVADEEGWYAEGRYLLTSLNQDQGGWTGGTYWALILDRQGRVVWARETEDRVWTIYARVSLDGDDLLLDEATYWSSTDASEGRVVRLKIDGTVEETVAMPGLHHAWVELDDGRYAYGRATDTHREYLTVTDPAKDTSVDLWGCEVWGASYCQSNALWYSGERDSYLYSFYTHDTVVEVDGTSGEVLHSWGRESDWTFDPEDSQFDWQHGATYTDSGTLLLSTHVSDDSKDCAVREYEVNEANSSLDEVWNFAVEDGIACNTAGEAHRLPNGNTLHNYGSGGRTREATADGTVVWDVEWEGERLQGRSVWLEDLYAFAP